jgi:hypothetical protein
LGHGFRFTAEAIPLLLGWDAAGTGDGLRVLLSKGEFLGESRSMRSPFDSSIVGLRKLIDFELESF